MSKLPIQTAIIIFVITLILAACANNESSQTAAPSPTEQSTPTPSLTTLPSLTPAPQPTATERPPEPQPTIATPTSIPTGTPMPLPNLLQNGRPLGVNWRLGAFTDDFIPRNENLDSSFIISKNYSPDSGVTVVNIATGEVIIERNYGENSSSYYDVFEDKFYIAIQGSTPYITIEQWNLNNGERNWERTIRHQDTNGLLATEEGVAIIASTLYPETRNSVIFLDTVNGQNKWEKPFLDVCNFNVRNMKAAENQIQIKCDNILYFVATDDGDMSETVYLRQGSIDKYAITNHTIFLFRETGGFYYLESWDLNLSNKLWFLQIPSDIRYFVTDGNDIIYRDGSQIYRLDGLTGEIKWQTVVEGDDPAEMLIYGPWLLAGSKVGFLHVLNLESGEVRWKQDVWATIEPRKIYVSPVAFLEDEIILDVLSGFLSISLNENWVVADSTPSITPTPTMTPTPTPIPTFVFSADGDLPEAPEEIELWPAAIIAFLNTGPSNDGRIEALLEKWTDDYLNLYYATGVQPGIQFRRVDLNGNGRQELIMALTNPRFIDGEGWLLIVQQELNGRYNIAWSQSGHIITLLAISDLNNDGTIDFVAGDWWSGGPTSSVALIPVGWNGQEFIELSQDRILSTNIRYGNISVEDKNGDGFTEIIFQGGSHGSAGAGHSRELIFTYVWSEDGYILESKEPVLPQDYYFFLVDANEHLVAGNYQAAINMYESSFDTEDAYYYLDADHQRAFAEFQLMLAHLLLGDEESAEVWAMSGNYSDELYSEVKEIFWNLYQETGDWTAAAEAARTRVRLAKANQIFSFPGYANISLTLEEILPCAECLQGTIEYGPW